MAAAIVMLVLMLGLRKVTATFLWMLVLFMLMLMRLVIVVVVMMGMIVMVVRTARSVFLVLLHLRRSAMIVPTRSMLIVMMFLSICSAMIMRAIMVSSSMHVAMQHIHDKQVAAQPNKRCQQHIRWLFNNRLPEKSLGSFHEQLRSYKPNDAHIDQRSKRLQFLIAEGKAFWTGSIAHENGEKRDDVCQHI